MLLHTQKRERATSNSSLYMKDWQRQALCRRRSIYQFGYCDTNPMIDDVCRGVARPVAVVTAIFPGSSPPDSLSLPPIAPFHPIDSPSTWPAPTDKEWLTVKRIVRFVRHLFLSGIKPSRRFCCCYLCWSRRRLGQLGPDSMLISLFIVRSTIFLTKSLSSDFISCPS